MLPKKKQIYHDETRFTVLNINTEDFITCSLSDWAEQTSNYIEENINNNKPVYVHCAYGISRSTSCILHYLMSKKNMNLKDSFNLVRTKRCIASPTAGFFKDLTELDKKLFGKKSFTFEEYSLFCLKESFPLIQENEINEIYEKNKKYYNENKDLYNLDVINKHNESIGYKTINDLWEKFGKKTMLLRKGCSIHHPFD